MIFHAHSLLTTPFDAIVSRSLGLPTVVRVIAGSRYVARPLLDRLPPGTVHVIYNGVPDCSGPLTGNGCGRIGVLGRISPEKGQLEFLQAARLLAAEKTDVRFVICGEPLFSNGARYYGRVRDAARGLPVEFYGWRENVSELLSQLDLLVVPSTGPESTTRVVLDAFSAGVPVVAFATGGIPEVIEDGRTGFLVGETSPEALAAAIGDLLGARQEEARAAASRARVEWRRRFTVQRFEEQVLAEIEELASAPRPVGVH